MEVWKIIFLSKWVICRFHVNLPGCTLRTGKNIRLKLGKTRCLWTFNNYIVGLHSISHWLSCRQNDLWKQTDMYTRWLFQISCSFLLTPGGWEKMTPLGLEVYGWWKKSCTSWYGKYPIICRASCISVGAGFLPIKSIFQMGGNKNQD